MDSRRVEKINSAIFTQKRRHYSASRKRCSMERESFRRISPKFKQIVTNDRWNWSIEKYRKIHGHRHCSMKGESFWNLDKWWGNCTKNGFKTRIENKFNRFSRRIHNRRSMKGESFRNLDKSKNGFETLRKNEFQPFLGHKDTRSSSLFDERRIFLKFRQIHRKMDSKRLEKIISRHFHAKKDTRSSSLLDEKKIFSKFREMIRKFHDPSKNGLVTLRENKFSHFSRQPGYTIVVIADEIPRSIEKWIQNT